MRLSSLKIYKNYKKSFYYNTYFVDTAPKEPIKSLKSIITAIVKASIKSYYYFTYLSFTNVLIDLLLLILQPRPFLLLSLLKV